MSKSLKEFLASFGRWWWIVLANYFGAIAGTVIDISDKPWALAIWSISLLFAVIIAPLIAFHKLRKNRDGLQLTINELKSGRPQLTLGDKTKITQNIVEDEKKVDNVLQLYYQNDGKLPAYQLNIQVGYAPEGRSSEFGLFSENTSANPIFPNTPQQGITHMFSFYYQMKGKNRITQAPKGVLIYCRMSYSDNPSNGDVFSDEWWYSYRFDKQTMSHLSIPRMKELEPYVRLAYKNKDAN